MSVSKKIDSKTISELRTILSKLSIHQERITIDLKNQTIEIDDTPLKGKSWSTEELMSVAGTLSPERALEMQAELKRSREEWDEEM